MQILRAVPNSVLWLLGQSQAARANLSRHAQLDGIDPARIIYAPFADPRDHLARLQVVDAVLDALVCNGHTTTSDALWAGVPVVTARGRHFASRVSESLLNGIGLPELVGTDSEDMVRIATRIATDATYRQELRAKVGANRLSTPLFDTARLTRDFEIGIRMMVERHRSGLDPEQLDVPDQGPLAADRPPPAFAGRVTALHTAYTGCPLCANATTSVGFADCTGNAMWHEPLPPQLEWLRCTACSHTHTRHFWNEAGRSELLRGRNPGAAVLTADPLAQQISRWGPVVERVARLLGGYRQWLQRAPKPIWVDVGCGSGALVMAANDHGFATGGVDTDGEAIAGILKLGFGAMQRDFMQLPFEIVPDVLSLMQVLALMPDPRAVLRKAAQLLKPGGVLVISTPDSSSATWKLLERDQINPYWSNPQLHHVFSRDRLIGLLRETGFEVADVVTPGDAPALLELYAIRK